MPPLGRRTADLTRSTACSASSRSLTSCSQTLITFQPILCNFVIIRSIAIHVPLELGQPVIVVAGRHRGVFRATMPKASVDEDRDTFGGKDDIDFDAPRFELDVTIFSEA